MDEGEQKEYFRVSMMTAAKNKMLLAGLLAELGDSRVWIVTDGTPTASESRREEALTALLSTDEGVASARADAASLTARYLEAVVAANDNQAVARELLSLSRFLGRGESKRRKPNQQIEVVRAANDLLEVSFNNATSDSPPRMPTKEEIGALLREQDAADPLWTDDRLEALNAISLATGDPYPRAPRNS